MERIFTKGDRTRTASTVGQAVRLRFEGWTEQKPPAEPAEAPETEIFGVIDPDHPDPRIAAKTPAPPAEEEKPDGE